MNEKLIKRCSSRIVMQSKYLNKLWVYGVYNSQQQLVFMSYGTLREIIMMSPFKTIEKFNENENYTFVLIQPCDNKIAAENALSHWINNSELEGTTPPFNIYNKSYNNRYFIQCLENGRYYQTASDIVKIFNVSQSALSNHLRGLPGHRSVKGLHFKYYTGPNPAEIEQAGGYKLLYNGFGYKSVPSDDPINRLGITDTEKREQIALLVGRYGGEIW